MNGDKLLFDSNIIIYLSKGLLDAKEFTNAEDVPHISVITYMEVMGYRFKRVKEKRFIEKFCADAYILSLDDEIVNKVIALRKEKNIKLPDAIITATALKNKMQLITRNTVDFKNIKGLNLFNPFDNNKE
ncbi:MAG: type II toxin-antitoxin system VapC family toxin [Cytophagales bacterium]|nr:type II toxin-antitoxin system VapC family toxin [Cytophagales bacterium]